MIGTTNYKNTNFVILRNPYTNGGEWKGDYSKFDKKKFQPDFKSSISYKTALRGSDEEQHAETFAMPILDFCKNFDVLNFCDYKANYKTTVLEAKTEGYDEGNNQFCLSVFKVSVSEPGIHYFGASQTDAMELPEGHEYAFSTVTVLNIENYDRENGKFFPYKFLLTNFNRNCRLHMWSIWPKTGHLGPNQKTARARRLLHNCVHNVEHSKLQATRRSLHILDVFPKQTTNPFEHPKAKNGRIRYSRIVKKRPFPMGK